MAMTPELAETLAQTLCDWETSDGMAQGACIETVAQVARRLITTGAQLCDYLEDRHGGDPTYYADLSAEDQAVWDGKLSAIVSSLETNEAYIRPPSDPP